VFVPYAGKPLKSRAVCYWKVRVTTNQGVSAWSEPAVWTMGLLSDTDWKAQWTGLDRMFAADALEGKTRLATRYFRKEFETPQKPVKAMLYLSGLGLYKLYVNGKKIGEQELSPTPTDYTQVVKYNTFDVTDNITKDKNALAVTLGNGRFFSMRIGEVGIPSVRHFGFPKMLLQLELEYADGSRQTVVSDDTWKVTAEGPIRTNSEFDGEEYDATKEMPGWNAAGFNDAGWLPGRAGGRARRQGRGTNQPEYQSDGNREAGSDKTVRQRRACARYGTEHGGLGAHESGREPWRPGKTSLFRKRECRRLYLLSQHSRC
jgi:alpha-L-rhamnosidase